MGRFENWRGVIGKAVLGLLTFGSNPDFCDFSRKKLNFQAVIKSAASAASLVLQGSLASPAVRMPSRRPLAPLQVQGGCASSQLDHGLKGKLYVYREVRN